MDETILELYKSIITLPERDFKVFKDYLCDAELPIGYATNIIDKAISRRNELKNQIG